MRQLLDRRTHAVQARRVAYRSWCDEAAQLVAERERWIERHLSRQQDRGLDYGIDL